jgi:hypothetical protein
MIEIKMFKKHKLQRIHIYRGISRNRASRAYGNKLHDRQAADEVCGIP